MKIIRNGNVFNMTEVGRTIARERKANDMTQSELAENLGVSHQAVSSWENGLTSPDISKLAEISEVLNISIDNLLDNRHMAKIIEKVEKEEDIDADELADIAPITKPKKFKELLDKMADMDVAVEGLYALAPFMESDEIYTLIENNESMGIRDLTPLAPFLESKHINKIVDKVMENDDFKIKDIISLAPFLSEAKVGQLAQSAIETKNVSELTSLAPFIDSDVLDELVLKVAEEDQSNVREYVALAPFMGKEALGKVVTMIIEEGNVSDITAFAPFL